MELRERSVRLVLESGRAAREVARDLGIHHESLRVWVRRVTDQPVTADSARNATEKKFTEPVALSSTRPTDRPLPRKALRLSFDLVALRARCRHDAR